jgi:hypothetical protein
MKRTYEDDEGRTDNKRRRSKKQKIVFFFPTDCLLNVFLYLDYTDLCSVSEVCKSWYELANSNTVWFQLYNNRFHRHNNIPQVVCHERNNWKDLFARRLDCEQFISLSDEFDYNERDDRPFTSNFEAFMFRNDGKASLSTMLERITALTEFMYIEKHDLFTWSTISNVIREQNAVMIQYRLFINEISNLISIWESEKRSIQKIAYLHQIKDIFHYERFHRGYSGSNQSITVQCVIPLMIDGDSTAARFDGFFSTDGRENPTGELVLDLPDQETIFLHFSKDEEEKKQSRLDFCRLKQIMHFGDELNEEELVNVLRCCFMPLSTKVIDDFKQVWRNQFTMHQIV